MYPCLRAVAMTPSQKTQTPIPMKTKLFAACLALLALIAPSAVLAQNYAISWYKIAGGGGTSTGGVYSVNGTIGQPDASTAMTGGSYSLVGGFWSMIAVIQSAGVPQLNIYGSGNSVVVAWPNTGTYTLLQNTTATGGSWVTSGYSVSTANGTNSITITAPSGNLFFRLKQ